MKICLKIGVKPCKTSALFLSQLFNSLCAVWPLDWKWAFLQIWRLSCFVSLLQGESRQQHPCEVKKRRICKACPHQYTGPFHLTALSRAPSLAESRACLLHLLWGTWKPGGAGSKLHWREVMRCRAAGYLRGQRSLEMELLTLERASVCNVMGPEERELFP